VRYLSVCSGIEAASVAWHPLGWEPVAFCEIEAFPSAVLEHRYTNVPNYGDFTRLTDAAHPIHGAGVDLLVGGTPCQAFSVAGLRRGLSDPRGGLTLEFVRLAQALRPKWIVWENVPGVLSQDDGRAFGSFLGALGELGYGFAYRVLDAQYARVDGYPHAVPQRRRRVFVVGCAGGDAVRAAAVLFEPEGVRRDSAPRRASRKATSSDAAGGIEISMCLNAGSMGRRDAESETLIPQQTSTFAKTHKPMSDTDAEGWSPQDHSPTITYWPRDRSDVGTDVAVVQPVAFDARQTDVCVYGDKTGPLDTDGSSIGVCVTGDCTHALRAEGADASEDGTGRGTPIVTSGMTVRRLTPTECERLQGFPDGWTAIPWKGKSASECPDGPRYKALGNSMACNVMRWIGTRIAMVDAAGGEA
jgi:DNA (cytosine-5)-methyltransferase 1